MQRAFDIHVSKAGLLALAVISGESDSHHRLREAGDSRTSCRDHKPNVDENDASDTEVTSPRDCASLRGKVGPVAGLAHGMLTAYWMKICASVVSTSVYPKWYAFSHVKDIGRNCRRPDWNH